MPPKHGTEGRVDDMREKLVELIRQIVIPFWAGEIADHLISNDVVPVVRCKDCKYCVFHSGADWCIRWRAFPCVKPDDFCSYGEREDGGGDA